MRTAVNIGGSHAMVLKGALLVYEGGSSSFVTWHQAKGAEDGGAPYLREAEPLTTDFLRTLAAGLGTYLAPDILPPCLLVRTAELLVWWTPAQQRTMFFAEHSEAGRELNGKRYPQPPLVFKTSGGELWVRALEKNERPAAETKLKTAPYWNCNEQGYLCIGTMRTPDRDGIDAIEAWERGFFQSEFRHASGAMLVSGHHHGLDVTMMDGDVVSATNCVRQPFSQAEIGHFKAVVLVSRINLFWGLEWKAVPHHLTAKSVIERADVVIGCADNRAARKLIAGKITGRGSDASYWLDLGNHATGGQFVLGQPWNWRNRRSATRLRTVAELFPELIDPARDDDGLPSCSALEALERQEPFVNQTLASHALGLLTRLFRYRSIEHHGAFVNLAANRVQPLAIDSEGWKLLQRRGKCQPHKAKEVSVVGSMLSGADASRTRRARV